MHPPDPDVTVDPDRFGRIVTKIESDTHRLGWDLPHQMYLIYDARVGDADAFYRYNLADLTGHYGAPPVRCDGYAAMVCVPSAAVTGGRHLTGSRGAHGVYRLALNATSEPLNPIVARLHGPLRHPGLRGIAYLHENWRMIGDISVYDPTVSLADRPGAVEERAVLAADIDARAWLQVRQRGHKPAALQSGPVVGVYDNTRGAPVTIEGTVSGDLFMIYTTDGGGRLTDVDIDAGLPDGVGVAFCGAIPEALNRFTSVLAQRPLTPMVCEPHGWDWADQKVNPADVAALREHGAPAPSTPTERGSQLFPPGFYAWCDAQLAGGG